MYLDPFYRQFRSNNKRHINLTYKLSHEGEGRYRSVQAMEDYNTASNKS